MSETEIQHFLIVYDIGAGKATIKSYKLDYDAALDAYAKAEEDLRERDDFANFEIVLVGADSIETVERTHSSYFHTEETFEALLPLGVLTH